MTPACKPSSTPAWPAAPWACPTARWPSPSSCCTPALVTPRPCGRPGTCATSWGTRPGRWSGSRACSQRRPTTPPCSLAWAPCTPSEALQQGSTRAGDAQARHLAGQLLPMPTACLALHDGGCSRPSRPASHRTSPPTPHPPRLELPTARLGDEAEAVAYHTEAFAADRTNLDTVSWLGAHHVRRQDYPAAVPYFEAAARAQPREVGPQPAVHASPGGCLTAVGADALPVEPQQCPAPAGFSCPSRFSRPGHVLLLCHSTPAEQVAADGGGLPAEGGAAGGGAAAVPPGLPHVPHQPRGAAIPGSTVGGEAGGRGPRVQDSAPRGLLSGVEYFLACTSFPWRLAAAQHRPAARSTRCAAPIPVLYLLSSPAGVYAGG